MADYITLFSCRLDTGSGANAARAIRRYKALERLMARQDDVPRFEVAVDPAEGSPGGIWIHACDGFGDPDHVIDYVSTLALRLKLSGRWGFDWSHSCTRPRTRRVQRRSLRDRSRHW